MNRIVKFSIRRPVVTFYILAYGLSWLAWSPLLFSDLGRSTMGVPLIIAGGFGPMLAAALATRLSGASVRAWVAQILRWRVGIGWYLAALLLPAFLTLAASGVGLLLGGEMDTSTAPPLYGYLIGVLFVFLLGGGQEEPGWRGFALPRLQARYGALGASLIIGVLWVFWHLPLFAVPVSSQAGLPFGMYFLGTLGVSIIFTWLYNNTGGSVLLPMLLHGAANTAAGWYLIGGAEGLQTTLGYGSYTLVVWILALILIAVYGPARLSRRGTPQAPAGQRHDS